ncbi:MAG: WecB/TagA/CpsF family glycosyltransferase [Myxococcota bacterium]
MSQHPSLSLNVCGLPVDNVTMADALRLLEERLATRTRTQLMFLNADCVNISHRDPEYRRTLQQADLVFADGIGMRIAGWLLGTPVRDNVNGTDLFPLACERLARSGHRVFLLGARPGVARKVQQWLAATHPGLTVCGVHHGYFDRTRSEEVTAKIRSSGADVLFVAMGAPVQEKWIAEHIEATGVTVALGVGGLFDFFSGNMPRAPRWMRRAGLEWVYRFWQEPRRMWKRYWVGNFVFMGRVGARALVERIRSIRQPGRALPAPERPALAPGVDVSA